MHKRWLSAAVAAMVLAGPLPAATASEPCRAYAHYGYHNYLYYGETFYGKYRNHYGRHYYCYFLYPSSHRDEFHYHY